jgi:hypothetical protein
MITSTGWPTPSGLVETLTYAKVGMVGVAALALGTSIIEADIESTSNKAIAIAPVWFLEMPNNLFVIFFFFSFWVTSGHIVFIFKTLPDNIDTLNKTAVMKNKRQQYKNFEFKNE